MSKFKAGDWWRTRGGSYVQIITVNGGWEFYPIEASNDNDYTKEGYFFLESGDHPTDLIQKMKQPVWEEDND